MNKITLRSVLAPLSLVVALVACSPPEETTQGEPAGGDASPATSQPATSQPATADKARPKAPDGQLPDGVRPTAYRLDLLLDPRRDDFSGTVEIDIELAGAADHIWMHGKDIRVSEALATTAAGKRVAARYQQVLDSGVVRVDFDETLPAGAFTLRLEYSAAFDRNLAGLFKVEEQGDSYALAKSESIQARKFLPGFDEPGFKAPFDISLTVPEGYAAISNGPELQRKAVGDGLELVTFATTRPTPTYLLSLSVGPFDVVEREAIPPSKYRQRPIPLRGFARRGRGDDLDYILDITPRMVEIFETELQRPYPFEKLDIIAAPQWPSGATELSAAITYREQRILVEGDKPAPGARLALLAIHAHEIAHMWFGNLVTPPWWDDLWLKEGFSTWGTPLSLTIMEPDGGHELNAAVRAISAMQLDSLESTRAIREPIAANDDIRNAYDSITYSKSLGVIHMVDQYFGPDRFRPALGRYVETFADGVADSDDFYRVIGEETNTPALTDTFRSFVEQKGVPLLSVDLNCEIADQPQVTIRQSRYRPLGSPIQLEDQQWTIPVCLRSDLGRQCLMLEGYEQEIALEGQQCPQWLLPNADGSGYYRWNFAAEQWQALVEGFGDFTPTEQLSIIDSAFAAFEAGELPITTALDIARASTGAERRQVITAPLQRLREYRRSMLPEKALPDFTRFLQRQYQPVLDRTADSEDPEQQLLHSQLLAFMALVAEDPAARKTLADRAVAFTGFQRERDPQALDSDLYEPALIVAVQDAGKDFLPHLARVRGELDDPRFENASANALGAANDPAQVETVQELALGEDMGAREAFGLISHAMAEPAVQARHWQWLQANFPAVLEKIPGQWRRRTPRFAQTFCTQDRLHQLRDLFEQHGELAPGHQRSLDQISESIDLCIDQREQAPEFIRALSR